MTMKKTGFIRNGRRKGKAGTTRSETVAAENRDIEIEKTKDEVTW